MSTTILNRQQILDDNEETVQTLTVKDIRYISKNMNHSKLQLYPKLPTSITEVHDQLKNQDIKTIQGEEFLLFNDKSQNIIMFSTTKNLEILVECEIILVDGTFDYSSKHFSQVLQFKLFIIILVIYYFLFIILFYFSFSPSTVTSIISIYLWFFVY